MHFVLDHLVQAVTVFSFVFAANAALNVDSLRILGPQGINLWKLERAQAAKVSKESASFVLQGAEDHQGARADSDFEARWFEQPLDHFSKESNHTFLQRYWVNDRHYVPGSRGPVIVLDGGETSGEDRLTYLDTGIVEILTKATGGLGLVLEHRYYGNSIPVDNFTTDSLRWLDNEQAAADSANFMSSIRFEGIDEDLTAPNTPWIYYGGSYAGARAAHMKILYPELTYGSIASSAVTHAAITNWEYMEVIRRAADSKCSGDLQQSITTIDDTLDMPFFRGLLKGLFGLQDLEHDDDFVSLLSSPLGAWQSKVWGPFDSTTFDDFCTALTKPLGNSSTVAQLPFGSPSRMVSVTDDFKVDFVILNYANYIKEQYVSKCTENKTVEECFGTYDDSQYQVTTLDQEWRLWQFQVCTQWGYFTTAPPDQNQPRIISRRLTLEYLSKICKQAYPPGKYFTVPRLPNITAVNALGDFDIAADRLAFIDGEVDPWRPDTPHSQFYAKDRPDTILRPFKLIPGAVHHWDEWGLPNIGDEPPEIQKIHEETIDFVTAWLEDFKAPGNN
ncbi:Thymus-specific serine protease [Termitomyces sp. J132]|nr:Thymus-specific serine protease [Termitomyces sp. J132]